MSKDLFHKNHMTNHMTSVSGEEKRVSVSGHTSRQVSMDMSHEMAALQTAADGVFELVDDEGSVSFNLNYKFKNVWKGKSDIKNDWLQNLLITSKNEYMYVANESTSIEIFSLLFLDLHHRGRTSHYTADLKDLGSQSLEVTAVPMVTCPFMSKMCLLKGRHQRTETWSVAIKFLLLMIKTWTDALTKKLLIFLKTLEGQWTCQF